jgi:geranylgeranyl diphosphate synthase type I
MVFMKTLKEFQSKLIPEFIRSVEEFVDSFSPKGFAKLKEMYKYHLGLGDDYSKRGKRIRPFLTLICCAGTGVEWQKALPAAVSIELIHNFSLIHDDIEDNGLIRRGKEAVWVKWGLPHGLNAGDAMFTSAFEVLLTLQENVSENTMLKTVELLTNTCGQLTMGQFLDIDFEEREFVSVDEYLQMVHGKTAALISCSTKMGALIGGLPPVEQKKYHDFGKALGVAFQMYDDWLGVWGDFKNTGKSTTGDIVEGKKTLPIILGIKNSTRFADKFKQGKISQNTAIEMAQWLREDGIEEIVIDTYTQWTENAFISLKEMKCTRHVRNALIELTNNLLIREK